MIDGEKDGYFGFGFLMVLIVVEFIFWLVEEMVSLVLGLIVFGLIVVEVFCDYF